MRLLSVREILRPLAFALVVIGCMVSAPAFACFCSCSGSDLSGYDQLFSGLVISTERVARIAKPVAGEDSLENPGYWVRTRILVLRIWRGAPSIVTEVWIPVVTDCDSPPIIASHFVALVQFEGDRSVAQKTLCNCDQNLAATEGPGSFTAAGVALAALLICAITVALLWLVNSVRRRRYFR
jgi:hypothetical protein